MPASVWPLRARVHRFAATSPPGSGVLVLAVKRRLAWSRLGSSSFEGRGSGERPYGAVRHLSAMILGALVVVLSLPSTACGDLACGDQCAGGSCLGQNPKACSQFMGCLAVSTCICAVYGTCSADVNQACKMSQSKAECDAHSACTWSTYCHQSKSCQSIGDAATCSASGCEWQHNCN